MSPEPLDPNKFHVLTSKSKKILLICGIFFALVVLPTLSYGYYNLAINRPNQTDKEITFEIKSGDNVAEIAKSLYTLGAINSETLFRLYAKLNKLDNNIQAGVYKIKAGTTLAELLSQLQHGTNDQKITFIEGWRAEEFAREASKTLQNIDYEQFVSLAKKQEGKLYPDTYYVNSNVTEEQLITLLTTTFQNKIQDDITIDNLKKVDLTMEQAYILTSIVEREVAKLEDKELVAGILVKRLKSGDLLGADATTQYIAPLLRAGCDLTSEKVCPRQDMAQNTKWWPTDLTQYELDYNNPYNTRKVAGLPPAPISSFTTDTLKAVLNYKTTPNNFYMHDPKGNIYYAKTLQEHNQNIAKYLR